MRHQKTGDGDDNGEEPQRPTKERMKRQPNMAKNSSNKRTKSGQANAPQKKAQKQDASYLTS